MKTSLGELYYSITGDTKQLDKAIAKTKGNFKDLTSVLGGAFAIAGVSKITKELLNSAVQAKVVQNKFDNTFKAIGARALEVQKALQDTYKLTAGDVQERLLATTRIGEGLGLAKDTALDLSKQVFDVAQAWAYYNADAGSAADITEKINAAIAKGSSKSLLELGIVIDETSESFKNEVLQLIKVEGLSEKAAKSQVIFNNALKQTQQITGALDEETKKLMQEQEALNSLIKDFKESLGTELIPIAKDVVKTLSDLLKGYNDLSPTQKELLNDVILITGGMLALIPVINSTVTFLTLLRTAALVPLLPIVAGAVIALGALAYAIKQVNEEEAGLKGEGFKKLKDLSLDEQVKALEQIAKAAKDINLNGGIITERQQKTLDLAAQAIKDLGTDTSNITSYSQVLEELNKQLARLKGGASTLPTAKQDTPEDKSQLKILKSEIELARIKNGYLIFETELQRKATLAKEEEEIVLQAILDLEEKRLTKADEFTGTDGKELANIKQLYIEKVATTALADTDLELYNEKLKKEEELKNKIKETSFSLGETVQIAGLFTQNLEGNDKLIADTVIQFGNLADAISKVGTEGQLSATDWVSLIIQVVQAIEKISKEKIVVWDDDQNYKINEGARAVNGVAKGLLDIKTLIKDVAKSFSSFEDFGKNFLISLGGPLAVLIKQIVNSGKNASEELVSEMETKFEEMAKSWDDTVKEMGLTMTKDLLDAYAEFAKEKARTDLGLVKIEKAEEERKKLALDEQAAEYIYIIENTADAQKREEARKGLALIKEQKDKIDAEKAYADYEKELDKAIAILKLKIDKELALARLEQQKTEFELSKKQALAEANSIFGQKARDKAVAQVKASYSGSDTSFANLEKKTAESFDFAISMIEDSAKALEQYASTFTSLPVLKLPAKDENASGAVVPDETLPTPVETVAYTNDLSSYSLGTPSQSIGSYIAQITVNLDSEPILKAVSEGTFNQNLTINSGALV